MDGDLCYKGSRVSITNIMAKIRCAPFELGEIAAVPGARHYQGRYTRVSIKLPGCHCNLYRTGVVVLMGCATMSSVHASIEHLSAILGEHFFPIDIKPVIVNMATRFALNVNKIDLNSFCTKYKSELISCIYEPELSNGVHFQLDFFSRIILHQTGKGIITGVKTIDEAYGVLKLMHNMLCQ